MRPRVLLALLFLASPAAAEVASVPTGTGAGLNAEIGTLGGPGSPMLSGRYFSLDGAKEGSGRYFDWSLEGRASVADLGTRWFDSVPPLDPRTPGLAGDPAGTRSEQSYFYGLLGRVGRAYPLWGPVDVGWSLLGVARLDALFPTLSLDQTVGLRARMGGDQSAGLFCGVTEGAAALTRDWAARALTDDHPAQARVVESPHLEVGAWGPIPSTRGSYQAFAGVQRNEFTTQTRLEGAVSRPGLGGTVSAGLRAEAERGVDMDFDRRERALRLGLDRGDGWEWSVEAGKRDVDFGGARFDGNFVQFGLTIREKTKGSATFRDTRSSGEISTPTGPWSHIQGEVRDAAAALDALLARIPPALAGVDPARAAADLRAAYEALPPEVRVAVADRLGGAPDFDRLAREFAGARPGAIAEVGSERARLARLLNELSDPERLERIVTRGLRVELYRALARTQFRLWGRDVSLTPGLLAAMVHAYGTGSGFVPPVSAKTFDPALDRWVAERVGERLGVSCGGADITACALAQLPPELRARLAGLPEAEARRVVAETLAKASEAVRLEANRFLLSAYLSAKALDPLTIERGETPGVIDRRAVMGSFDRLDERRRGPSRPAGPAAAALEDGARRLAAEIAEGERLEAARALSDAAALRRELAAAGVESTDADLARLCAWYGTDALRSFAVAARAKLDGSRRVVLVSSSDPLLGLSVATGAESTRLSLPPAPDRDPGRMLDALLSSLEPRPVSTR